MKVGTRKFQISTFNFLSTIFNRGMEKEKAAKSHKSPGGHRNYYIALLVEFLTH